MSAGPELPSGTVTFLFTDIEGSTRLLSQLGQERYGEVLGEHERILRAAFAAHGGRVVDTQGDSFFVAFRRAREAVAAALEAQRELATHGWPDGMAVKVRMGLHTGEPAVGEERYLGLGVHRAARVGAAGHGGQVLLSQSTRELLRDDPLSDVRCRDLGLHPLKDLDEPERIYQLLAPGLPEEFPPLRTTSTRRHRLLHTRGGRLLLVAVVLVAGGGVAVSALLVSGSSAARPVRLAANSLAVIDPRTNRPVGDVPLSFTPSGVVAGGDQVWVLDSTGRTATAIDAGTLRVVRTVGGLDVAPAVGTSYPGGQWAGGGTDWVAGSGAVDELAADNPGGSKIALWKPTRVVEFTGSNCLPFVTGTGGRVWVSEGRHLAELDATNGSVRRTLRLTAAPGFVASDTCYGVLYSGGQLFAVRDPDESIGYLDPVTGAYAPVLAGFPGLTASTGEGLVSIVSAGFGSLWIGTSQQDVSPLRSRGYLTRVDPASGQILAKVVVGESGLGVAIDPGSGVWVLDGSGETLVRVDPATTQVSRRVPLQHFPSSVAAGHGRIWVTLQSP